MIAPSISREALLHVVKKLPAAPKILAQLGTLLLDPNSDLSDVIELLKHDSALTARIIRVSNSAVYGGAARAASVEEALLRVGFNEVYRLVGLAAVAQISDESLPAYGISGVRFRENSLLTAFIVEALSPMARLDPRAAYTAGLLRSIGKFAVDRLMPGPVYARSYPVTGKSRPIDEWEMESIGINNCSAAAVVLEAWQFPAVTINTIRDHYRPGSESQPMSHALNLAAGVADEAGFALPGEGCYWGNPEAKQMLLNIEAADVRDAYTAALAQFERARMAIS